MSSSLVINCTVRSRLLPLKVDNRISSFYCDISVCCTTIVTYLNNFVKTQQNVGGRWLGERKHLWLLGWLVLDVFSILENECSGQSWSVVPPLGYGRNTKMSNLIDLSGVYCSLLLYFYRKHRQWEFGEKSVQQRHWCTIWARVH